MMGFAVDSRPRNPNAFPTNRNQAGPRSPVHFTKLRLNGFKSFVDPTDLLIQDGLTGVVGPNGCGKSNLLEALRWVMGENRPTAMRGGGMEDVIFAGAATRPARNFAEVALTLDNSERLAPASFNESDTLEIIRRITRDAGSAYKVNGKDVRARDVQMLFADASTGAHSPALVRQGQIAELINAKPKARRRILEEAAGISGLYQRRHEAELKLKGAETNLARVEDVLEQLASQLAQLARQARQAARYREIGNDLRKSEGVLLYRRWKEADDARADAEAQLTERTKMAAQAETAARSAAKAQGDAEDKLPPLREEEAVAAAVLQRLTVQRDTLSDQEARALETIERLKGRIEQLVSDAEREAALNRDAGETIERLEWEQGQLAKTSEGHEAKLAEAMEAASEAARVLQDRETTLSQSTEDVARLSARHQSAHRLLEDCHKTLDKSGADATKARDELQGSHAALETAKALHDEARKAQEAAVQAAADADKAFVEAEESRAEAQSREADARAERSSAEGEANALSAEVTALARLVEREASDDETLLDRVQVKSGYEKALGAALADDLRAPEIAAEDLSGWVTLPAYTDPQGLPSGVSALTSHVTVPGVLARRMAQVGLVDADDGARLQPQLKPGQRLVSVEGDLWRWDGFKAAGEDAPSAAALRLQQINRLQSLKQDLEGAAARAEGMAQAHDHLVRQLEELTEADRLARQARRDADQYVANANRALSRAEADASIAEGKLENLRLAVARHEEEEMSARARLSEAEAGVAGLENLGTARAEVEDLKLTVEAARVTMLSKRSAHDELRREGEARTRRSQEITKEVSGWRHRLETAGKRIAELEERRTESEDELKAATAAPDEIAAKREELSDAMTKAEERRRAAADVLAEGETALRAAQDAAREAERGASDAREARARAEALAEAARETVAASVARIEEEQEVTPQELLAALDADPEKMPPSDKIEAEVLRLRRQRDALGAVNLRAEEDAREVQE